MFKKDFPWMRVLQENENNTAIFFKSNYVVDIISQGLFEFR